MTTANLTEITQPGMAAHDQGKVREFALELLRGLRDLLRQGRGVVGYMGCGAL